MSTYLIVGGVGYIGSHVVKQLVNQGHRVVVLDDLSTGHWEAVKGSTDYADYTEKKNKRSTDYPSEIKKEKAFNPDGIQTTNSFHWAGGAGADYAEIKDKDGEFIQGDLGDRELLGKIFTRKKIDCVMHFAAFSLVGESMDQPLEYYENNTAKTNHLLMAMREHGVIRFILSSTAAVYGEPKNVPILETDPTEPTNPYGRSKPFIERILEDCNAA